MLLYNDVYDTWVAYIYPYIYVSIYIYEQNMEYNSDFVKEKLNRMNRLG